MDNFQALWQLVQQIAPGAELEPPSLQLELDAYRGRLLALFQNQVILERCRLCGGSWIRTWRCSELPT